MASQAKLWGLLLGCVVASGGAAGWAARCKTSDPKTASSPTESVWVVGAAQLPPARECVPSGFRMTAVDEGAGYYNEARQTCGAEGPEVRIPWPVSTLSELPHLESDGRRLNFRYDMVDRSIHVPGVAQRLSVARDPLPTLEFEADHD